MAVMYAVGAHHLARELVNGASQPTLSLLIRNASFRLGFDEDVTVGKPGGKRNGAGRRSG